MIGSLALVLLVGLGFAAVFEKMKLPNIIGMLLAGVLLGPSGFGLLSESMLLISPDLRKIALIIIIVKAGLSLDLGDLKRVGRPALLMSFLPASFELLGIVLLAPVLLGFTLVEAAILGAVLAAVSPAVVVPRMIKLMEEGYGTDKAIPQLILAGASLDDIYVIVLFSVFTGIATGGAFTLTVMADVPISIISGILLGGTVGLLLYYTVLKKVSTTQMTIILLGVAFMLITVEELLSGILALSGLLGVMSMSMMIGHKSPTTITEALSHNFSNLWGGAQVLLFVLVGATVRIEYVAQAGGTAVLLLVGSLIFRGIGVCFALLGTSLTFKEKLFCIVAYLPKATVQAAIGATPLAMGLPCGEAVLTVAVVAIIFTAPLGAFGMDVLYPKLLTHTEK